MIHNEIYLDNPIDLMHLVHKAFMAHSVRTENLARDSVDGGDLLAFKESFEQWAKLVRYHMHTEDRYMTTPLVESQSARQNETEHEELREGASNMEGILVGGDTYGLSRYVNAVMQALDEEQHNEFSLSIQEVEKYLKQAIGEERVVARTRRHLYGKAMALRMLEFDHFENEEAFVITQVRENMTVDQQMEIARHLLIDSESENPRWIIDWLFSELDADDRQIISSLESRF
jgi:hypothetical protein